MTGHQIVYNMKNIIIGLMILQLTLMGVGVYQLANNQIGIGSFNLFFNLVFFFVNVNTLSRIDNE